jgi:hypothetical protein
LQQKFKGMQQMAPQLTKAQMKLPQTKREAATAADAAASCAAQTASCYWWTAGLTDCAENILLSLPS